MFAYRRSSNIEITEEFKKAISLVGDATIARKIKWDDRP
jgi:hypothetical protein